MKIIMRICEKILRGIKKHKEKKKTKKRSGSTHGW